jgi:hypothetical protein
MRVSVELVPKSAEQVRADAAIVRAASSAFTALNIRWPVVRALRISIADNLGPDLDRLDRPQVSVLCPPCGAIHQHGEKGTDP